MRERLSGGNTVLPHRPQHAGQQQNDGQDFRCVRPAAIVDEGIEQRSVSNAIICPDSVSGRRFCAAFHSILPTHEPIAASSAHTIHNRCQRSAGKLG